MKLEVAAGAEGCEGVGEDYAVRLEAGNEGAAVDIIERGGEEPVVFGVINFEAAIWGNAGWSGVLD